MSNPNCHDCIYLGSEPVTDNWLRSGDVNYWCENEHVTEVPEDLEEDFMEDYPDKCNRFKHRSTPESLEKLKATTKAIEELVVK